MDNVIRPTLSVLGLALFITICWYYYPYFFGKHTPCIEISGLHAEQHVAGELNVKIICTDQYKINDFCLWLDDKLIADHLKINKKRLEYPVCLDTTQLSQGKHLFKIRLTNSVYKTQQAQISCCFYVDNTSLEIALLRMPSELKVMQGRTIHLILQVNKPLQLANIEVFNRCFKMVRQTDHSLLYEAFIGVECEQDLGCYDVTIHLQDYVGNKKTLNKTCEVINGNFKKQQTICVDDSKLQQESVYKTEQEFEESIKTLTAASSPKKLWHGGFYSPIDIANVSTEYGTVRTTQERGRYMHKAVDIVNKPRSVVWATQDGIIVLKDRFAHSGNTIVIDHGCGILSLFFHLDTFGPVSVGQIIKKGNPLGTLGQTGYAKGYHLHWEMRIANQHVDPMQWIDPYF